MASKSMYYPKTLDENWPAIRAKNFVKALGMKHGKTYAENMAILAGKLSVTVEELIVMNPVSYAQRNKMDCRELLGRRLFDKFSSERDPAPAPAAAEVPLEVLAAVALAAPVPAEAGAKDVCTLPMTNNTMQKLTSYKNIILPPGTYYIGDLCYPLGYSWIYKKAWDDTAYETPVFFRSNRGCIVLDRTAFGDGSYSDNGNRSYSVDAGVISIVSIELIEHHLNHLVSLHNHTYRNIAQPHTMRRLTNGGHVFTFKEEVTINFGHGLFRVWSGDEKVVIDTDPPEIYDE